jgi:hypothetical protein
MRWEIKRELLTIYQQGGARDVLNLEDHSGSKETICFTVPVEIEMVVFGAMPPHNMTVPATTILYESNIIYYRTYEGVTTTIASRARYAAGTDLDGPIILTPGSYELTIELVKNTRGMFVTLY